MSGIDSSVPCENCQERTLMFSWLYLTVWKLTLNMNIKYTQVYKKTLSFSPKQQNIPSLLPLPNLPPRLQSFTAILPQQFPPCPWWSYPLPREKDRDESIRVFSWFPTFAEGWYPVPKDFASSSSGFFLNRWNTWFSLKQLLAIRVIWPVRRYSVPLINTQEIAI